MFTEFLHFILTTLLIICYGRLISSEAKAGAAYDHDLLISKVNVSNTFTCYSDDVNKSIIWERSPIGPIIYSINRINPDTGSIFTMDISLKPTYILTLPKARLFDAGVYTCKQEVTEGYLKQITHIVVETDPLGVMSQNETANTVDAWCGLTFTGNNSNIRYTLRWYSQFFENGTELNSSLNYTDVFNEEANTTITTLNSSVSVTDLKNGSYLICKIVFELLNCSKISKHALNWTSPVILSKKRTEAKLQSTAFASGTTFSNPEDQTSQMFTSSSKIVYDTTSATKERKSEGTLMPAYSQPASDTNWLMIGMTVAFVSIVIVLIVVIICMYAYFRSKSAASRRRRVESSYAMPLPPELPRSTSYERIEPIYHEPNANRGSIISSHSYNYPEKHLHGTSDAPPLPERDISVDISAVGKKDPNWTSAEKSNGEDITYRDSLDPGVYLRMPTDFHPTTKEERFDELGYTLVPGDYGQSPIPLNKMPSIWSNGDKCSPKIKKSNDRYEHPTPNIYDGYSVEQKDLENNIQSTSFVKENKNNVKDSTQNDTPDKGNRYTKIVHKHLEGYEKPVPEVPDHARYFPLTKAIGEDLQCTDINLQHTKSLDTDMLVHDSGIGTLNISNSGQATQRNDENIKYIKIIADD